MDLFYSDWADMHLPVRHRFPIEKYTMAREILQSDGHARVLPGPLATVDEACLAHDADYVQTIVTGRASEQMRKRVGFADAPMESYVLRTLASLGATVAATRRCLGSGGTWSGALSGGTHHAFSAAGEGFCVFNDVAVAARLAQKEFGVASVLIVDLDVHQGNGTAGIFEGDDSVFTVSLHQAKGFPFSTRCASDVDVDLPDGCDDDSYMCALECLGDIIARVRPGLLIYQSGVDGLAGDRFGRLALTREGLRRRNALVFSLAAEYKVPVVVTMGGGYHKDIAKSVDCAVDVYRQAISTWQHAVASS